jgi:flagellar motor switch protein FliN/FliY
MAAAALNETQKSSLEGALQGAGEAAASTLSGLLSRQAVLTPAGVSTLSPADVAERYMGGVVHIGVTLSGAASGKGLFVFPENIAALAADLMIGGDGSSPPDSLSDLHLSAVGEVGNQMASSFVDALGTGLGKSVQAMAGDLTPAQAGDLSGIVSPLGAEVVAAEFAMDIENGPSGTLLFLLSPAAASALTGAAKAAGAPAGGSTGGFTATSDFSGQSSGAPLVQSAQMGQISGMGGGMGGNNLELLMDVPLQVTVELGRTQKLVKEVLALGPGSVVELDKLAGEPVDILVNERPIAKGEVVVIDENFGIRVTEILSPKDRLNF